MPPTSPWGDPLPHAPSQADHGRPNAAETEGERTGVRIAAPAEEADQAAPIEEATAEPSRVATTVTGGQIDFGSFEGQDVVLWFWAPW